MKLVHEISNNSIETVTSLLELHVVIGSFIGVVDEF